MQASKVQTDTQIEAVVWVDSVQLGGWAYPGDMAGFGNRKIVTVGIVVEDNDDHLLMAMSVGDAGEGDVFCNWMSIPKSCILSRNYMIPV